MTPAAVRVRKSAAVAVAATLLAALAIATTVLAAAPRAQSAAAPDLQAAFLLNFARFTEWPDSRQRRPIVMCVFGDVRVTRALLTSVRDQTIDGRALHVTELTAAGDVSPCDVLFLGKSSMSGALPLLRAASRLPVLTVSDSPSFAANGGIVELFVEDGRMRFAINIDVARRSRLTLSSRLLGLARIVRGAHAF